MDDSTDSATQAFDELMTGIRYGSMRILDNLGIVISMVDLPSWPLRSYLAGQLYGTNGIARIWCVYIRPWLMPKRQAEIEQAFEIAGNYVRHELLAATLEKGQELIAGE